jgi:hypothetical protein
VLSRRIGQSRLQGNQDDKETGQGYMIDLRKVLDASARQLEIELDLLRDALRHSGQKGTVAEGAFKQFLQEFLPNRLGITEGIIISSDGFVSAQMDIIIYDAAECPVLFSRGATKVIPIEFVYAIFEVKTSMSSRHFDDFLPIQRAVKGSVKHLTDSPFSITYHAYGDQWQAPPILSGLISLECNSVPRIWDAYKAQYQDTPKNLAVDFVIAGIDNLFCHWNEVDGLAIQLRNPDKLAHVVDHATFVWWTLLNILAAQWKMLKTPEIYRYARGSFETKILDSVQVVPSDHPTLLPGAGTKIA